MSKAQSNSESKLRLAQEKIRDLEDALLSVTAIPVEYLTWLGAAEHVAQNGVKRDSEGGTTHFASTGTQGPGNFQAMLLVEAERKHMRDRARVLMNRLDELVGESAA